MDTVLVSLGIMIGMLLWKLSEVVVQRILQQKPLLAPIVAHQDSKVSFFDVLFHLRPSENGAPKMGHRKWVTENSLDSRGPSRGSSRERLLKNELFKKSENSIFFEKIMRKPKKSTKSTSQAQPAKNGGAKPASIDLRQVISFHSASYQEGSRVVGRIFRIYKKITGGADGSVAGLNGSIRPLDLVRILGALEIQGREFIDFGAGDGRVLLSAILGSATKASGYELPVNKAHSTILHAVLRSIEKETDSGVEFFEAAVHWIGRDINSLQSIPSCPSSQSCIYSFWVGMPFPTQEKILLLCASSQNVSALAVFRDRKWRHPDEGDLL